MKLVFAAVVAIFVMPVARVQALADVRVVASIKPVHSLVAAVMEGVGEPTLLVKGAASPHTYSLTPSDAMAVQDAEVIFWLGHDLEAFLEKPLQALPAGATVVSLMDTEKLERLPVREGAEFDAEEHGSEDGHGHGDLDPHVWLDPQNAALMANHIATTLSAADPSHAETYEANAKAVSARLAALELEIAAQLAPLKGSHFITFHDAFQYFEKRFGLPSSGAIAIHPETPPGAKGIRDIRDRLQSAKVRCVFSEPQFDPKLVNVIIEGTDVKTGVLDAEAGTLEPGPALYEKMLRNIAMSLRDCLS